MAITATVKYRLIAVLFASILAGLSSTFAANQSAEAVALKPFVVEANSAPAFLKIKFRHHLIWSGIHTMTFKSVPAGWAKAGIKIGDQVVEIDGKPVDGMVRGSSRRGQAVFC